MMSWICQILSLDQWVGFYQQDELEVLAALWSALLTTAVVATSVTKVLISHAATNN